MSVVHSGSCHCGSVKWSCEAPAEIQAISCNCSICAKKQNHHFIVDKGNFKLLQGEDNLTTYTFNKGIAQHKFCRICGVQSFYIPRSNPDSVAVMPHCIDSPTVKALNYKQFNGQNWEAAIEHEKPVAYKN